MKETEKDRERELDKNFKKIEKPLEQNDKQI